MREVVFLNRNAEKWKQFETLLANPKHADPDRLAELYVQLNDDLSYARTYFPGTRTVTYLNSLAGQVHQRIYRNKKENWGRVLEFWRTDVPTMIYAHRKELVYSFVFFSLAVLIGAFSALNDGTYIRLILGDAYVNMTLDNIRKGDPMGIYKLHGPFEMLLMIPMHNIEVALRTYAMGMLASIGTLLALLYNGVMVGAFHAFFFQHGLLGTSLLSVWLHGALEITSIVIAGCAGLVVGNSLLFPGTYTRLQSFRRGAIEGLKIVIGLIPFFLVAGFLESFVTRYTDMPLALNLAIIILSFAILIWYFVIYPSHVHRRAQHAAA